MTEEIYRDLIEAVRQLSEKSVLDYVIAIAPIVLSIVAVIISLSIAYRQKKIDLFEKRFEVYAEIQRCLAFQRLLTDARSPKKAHEAFCAAYGCDESVDFLKHGWAVQKYIPIEKQLMQAHFLFNGINEQMLSNVCRSLLAVLLQIETQDDLQNQKLQFNKSTTELLQQFCKIHDQLKLK